MNLTPENIIKGNFILFEANIFKDVTNSSHYFDNGKTGTVDGRTELRNAIAGWYYALRNLAIVALLSVLVYVGIRMITSTISQDKAKYKVMFKDWLIALCLVIVMHYIMISILNISSMITEAIGTQGSAGSQTEVLMQKIGSITEAEKSYTVTYQGNSNDDIRAIFVDDNKKLEFYDIGNALAFMLLLLVIIIYTVIFAVKYLKREFTIIFLILLGPISCITYPIDKISDGKAQAFNKWFYEFLYNVIIQPFHLLIYIVLVGSATKLADDNILYSIICFAVMMPAEKFIKEMFGFRDKLGSPLGGFAGGALASQLFNKMKGGVSKNKAGGGENDSTPNKLPPKTKNDNDLIEGNTSNNIKDKGEGIQGKLGEDSPNTALGEGVPNNIRDDTLEDDTYKNDTLDAAEQADQAQGEKDFLRQLDDAKGEQKEDEESEAQEKGSDNDNEPKQENKLKKMWNSKPVGTIRSVHNQRMAKKWGSTSRGQRWARRVGKGAKGITKFVGRTALTGAGALALGTVGFMTGQGTKGALAGAALGNSLYKKGESLVGAAVNTGKDYANAFRKDEGRVFSTESKAFKEFSGDKKQLDKAVYSYRKNHDGQDPSRKQLQQEMEDRFELSRYNLTDEQIDDCLPLYQKKKAEFMPSSDELKNMTSKERIEKENRAKQIAASQAKYTANLAKAYSPKDFMDSKVMGNAYDRITKGLIDNTGCSEIVADKYARQYLSDAAGIKNVSAKEIALPNETIKIADASRGGTATTDMKIKVKEGKVKVEQTGQGKVEKRKVTASIDFVENPENKREIERATSTAKQTSGELDIDVRDGEARKQIDRTRESREDGVKRRKTVKSDERVERLELEDKVSKDSKVVASKEKIQKKTDEATKEITEGLDKKD